jgi:D-alanyl-D-alanine dipeptidase
VDGLARLTIALAVVAGAAHARSKPIAPIAPSTKQLVVVVTDGWDEIHAQVSRWQRSGRGWKRVGAPLPAVVGRSGLAWGAGLEPRDAATANGGPVKHEGDGRAPAGVFRLVEATGYDAAPPAGTTLRYRQADARLRCVDDVKSPAYNQLVEEPEAGPPWSSAEKMHRDDALYTRTIVVEHNRAPVEPGRGSCIFIHAWSGPDSPTVGCTALAPAHVEELLAWLRADAQPLFVALPREAYGKLAAGWGLPPLAK